MEEERVYEIGSFYQLYNRSLAEMLTCNDGINDRFYVTGQNICEYLDLIVYNRWGHVILQTKFTSNLSSYLYSKYILL